MQHIPVMLDEALAYLDPQAEETMIDCTLGGGGHAEALLRRLTRGRLVAIDQDKAAIERVHHRLTSVFSNLTIVHGNFAELGSILRNEGLETVDGILYDLGVSSYHFDEGERGFSYRHDAPLDMRMDRSADLTASDIVNTYTEDELKRIIYRYGEDRYAPVIARFIVKARKEKHIETTFELVDIIKTALPQKALSAKGHPAKQTFQALRIAVNDELGALKRSLTQALERLSPGGRLVVISFHSLEDRLVKQQFRTACTVDHPEGLVTMPEDTPAFETLHKKVVVPSLAELATNHRAHSAKLRAIRKIRL